METNRQKTVYSRIVKRILDVVFSLVLLLLLWPVILLFSVIVKITSEGPVIFRQERIGYRKKVFIMYKLRSMYHNTEHTGSGAYSLENDDRVTKIGKFLRSSSLDELPQLVNVLKGDMSFVGPRPPLTYHPWTIDKYSEKQLHMFDARPGITGWAQINGRKHVEWNKRIELNNWYIDNMSFALDMKIVFKTVGKVISKSDVNNISATVTEVKTDKDK